MQLYEKVKTLFAFAQRICYNVTWNGSFPAPDRRICARASAKEVMDLAEYTKELTKNRKAWHDYFIEDTYEAGIALAGTEVKSLRTGKCSVKESFVRVENGEVYIYGMHISPYEKGNIFNRDSVRVRKLLMHKDEIRKLDGKVREKGVTIVPLQVYFKGPLVKVQIGLARGKKLYDKRDDIAKKDMRREAERSFKVKNLY